MYSLIQCGSGIKLIKYPREVNALIEKFVFFFVCSCCCFSINVFRNGFQMLLFLFSNENKIKKILFLQSERIICVEIKQKFVSQTILAENYVVERK